MLKSTSENHWGTSLGQPVSSGAAGSCIFQNNAPPPPTPRQPLPIRRLLVGAGGVNLGNLGGRDKSRNLRRIHRGLWALLRYVLGHPKEERDNRDKKKKGRQILTTVFPAREGRNQPQTNPVIKTIKFSRAALSVTGARGGRERTLGRHARR